MSSINKEERIDLFNSQATHYDRRRKKKRSFDQKWRKELLSYAKGKILEISAGAGANFRFYPSDVKITAVDASPAMISKAIIAADECGAKADFITSFVEDIAFPRESFDTVVSTLSMCTYDDPLNVLNLLNQWCKKDGLILLLEHGASKYKFIRWFQDRYDRFQYRRIGCHTNRNILDIVSHSDLEIIISKRRAMGILYIIHAKPGI